MCLEVLPIYVGMLVISMSNIGHYSWCNFLFLCLVNAFKLNIYYPFLICNSFSVATTWYFANIVDNTLAYRMIQRNNWWILQYLLGDFMLHFIPLLWSLCTMRMMYQRTLDIPVGRTIVQHSGLYSLFMNHLWVLATTHGFQPEAIYVEQPPRIWNMIWIYNAISHLLPHTCLMYLYGF